MKKVGELIIEVCVPIGILVRDLDTLKEELDVILDDFPIDLHRQH